MSAPRDRTLPLGSGGDSLETEKTAQPSGIEATLQADSTPKLVSGVEATLPGPETADYDELVAVESAHYVFGRELARGGMGRIITARDRRLGREVAVKTLLATNVDLRRRFEREARVTARLQHPAIVPVYEAGRLASGEPFYAMKLVSGRPLDAVIGEATTVAARIALLPKVIVVAEALSYAHAERVIHRDLKPQNILVGDFGETVVIDWGLAKDLSSTIDDVPVGPYRAVAAGEGNLTQVGAVMGTPAYMAPEQARGETVDAAADVYALGAILYHALAGAPPVRGKTVDELLTKVLAGPPPALVELAPDVPRDLATLVDAAMARDPAARPSSKKLAEELRRFQAGQLVASHAYSFGELARRWLRRHRVAVGVGAAAVAVLAVISVIGVRQILSERDVANTERAAAQAERARAEQTSLALLEEQGRRELLDGEHDRAAVWLAAAYNATDTPSPALRFLLAEALAPLEAPRLELGKQSVTFLGQRLLVADKVARLLDRDGREIARIDAEVLAASAKPGIVGRTTTGAVALYDAATGAAKAQLATGGVTAAVMDGDRIALVGASGLELVDATGRRIATIAGPVKDASFARDRRYLVARDAAGAGGVWEVATGTRTVTVPGAPVTFLGDNHVRATDATGALLVWDRATGKQTLTLRTRPDAHVTLLDGGRLVAVDADRSIGIWSLANGQRLFRIPDPHGAEDAGDNHIAMLVADDKGTLVATAGYDSNAAVFDTRTGRQLAKFNVTGQQSPTEMFFLGDRLVTANEWDGVVFWDPRKGVELSRIGDLTGEVDVTADGSRIVTGSKLIPGDQFRAEDGSTTIYSSTGAPLARLPHGDRIEGAAFVDGDRKVMTWGGRRLRLWDLEGRLLSTLVHTAQIEKASYRDGWVLLRDPDGVQVAWQPHVGPGRSISRFEAIEADDGFDLDATGTKLLVRSIGSVQLHDAITGKLLVRRDGDAFWDPTFARIVFSWRTEAVVLDAATLRELATLRGHTKAIEHAAWSPDGTRLATAAGDRTARIWDASTGQLLTTVPHDDEVRRVLFHPDSRRLLTNTNATARLFDGTREVARFPLDPYATPMFDARGTRLIAAPELHDSTGIQIRDASTLALLAKLAVGQRPTFSLDAARILTHDEDGARLLDERGATIATMPRLGTETARFAGRDDSFVLVGAKDATVTMWDLRGRLLAVLHGPSSLVKGLAASRDGTRIAAGDARSFVQVWNITGETRPASVVAGLVAKLSMWRLEDNRLVPR